MRRALSVALALVLVLGVGVAIFVSVRGDGGGGTQAAQLTEVRAVSGSEKEPFFRDPDVVAAFARNGVRLTVDYAGSRQIAGLDLAQYDFAFPAGVTAAEKIRRERKPAGPNVEPFYTPMVIATFKPIAEVLARNKIATRIDDRYWRLDVKAYLDLVAKNTRWNELPGNGAYPARKSVLISSTDVRTSNSAAQYLAITSYVANGDNIVASRPEADKVLPAVSPVFLRQGFSAASSEEPFEDYLTIGVGKTPMVMIYEAQFLSRLAAKDQAIGGDMVLMYPSPTVLTKHTVVPLTADGVKVGQLLTNDPDLRRLAIKYGYRTADPRAVSSYLAERGVPAPPALVDVIEPPTYETLEYLITRIQQQIQGN